SPGPVNPRRMVPPYRPISCTGLMTSGSSPIRSLTDGSFPAFTSSASCGASLKVLGNLVGSVMVVGPSSFPMSCPSIVGGAAGGTCCLARSNSTGTLIPAAPALRNRSRRDSLRFSNSSRSTSLSMAASFAHSVNRRIERLGSRQGNPAHTPSQHVRIDFVLPMSFVLRSNAQLAPGQFWSIPLSDGRFACGRVLRVDRDRPHGGRTMFVAALLDWVGAEPPTAEAIAGRPVLEVGHAHVRTIGHGGGRILGERPLTLDGIAPPIEIRSYWGTAYAADRAE